MKHGVILRKYNGTHYVEFNTPSVGITLLATTDKEFAQAVYGKFHIMAEWEIQDYLTSRPKVSI